MPSSFEHADISIAALVAYLAVAYIAYVASGALPSDKAPARRSACRVVIDRAAFALIFALTPTAAFKLLGLALPGREVLAFGDVSRWALPSAILSTASWAVGRYSKKSRGDVANYPQYLPGRWGAAEMAAEVLSWAGYLAAYEFVFRGMILHAFMPLGYPSAIAAETALYSFAHLPKSSKEAAGAVLFGVVTSWMTVAYGTILPAFALHLAMALGNDRGCWVAMKRG